MDASSNPPAPAATRAADTFKIAHSWLVDAILVPTFP
jgi:hypothetical protein